MVVPDSGEPSLSTPVDRCGDSRDGWQSASIRGLVVWQRDHDWFSRTGDDSRSRVRLCSWAFKIQNVFSHVE